QSDHAGGDYRTYVGQFLKERRFLRNNGDSCAGIKKQKQPERPPLPGLKRLAKREVAARAMRSLARCRRPTHRLPTIGRILYKQSGYNCDDQVCDPEISEC